MGSVRLLLGDCLDVMPVLDANSIDAIVTDPPYGLSFMGKDWDRGVPGAAFWTEALRVAKPGAHMLAFGGTRTFYRLACAIEDAGWEIRDTVMWVYGQGFPKSLDVSKAIDKAAGAEREVVGESPYNARRPNPPASERYKQAGHKANITAPATPEAEKWQGWGTALKPAWEPIILARKPLQGTVAANVLAWGTGAINVDGCRVEGAAGNGVWGSSQRGSRGVFVTGHSEYRTEQSPLGRWPANFVHDGSEEVLALMPETGAAKAAARGLCGRHDAGDQSNKRIKPYTNSIRGHDDNGGSAARFFYCAKASKADRDEGLDGMEERIGLVGNKWTDQDYRRGDTAPSVARRNHHPTVKPTALMRYLCRLITPPGGTVLDPFMGSGSTGKAAVMEGFDFMGIEVEPEYYALAEARIAHAQEQHTPQLEFAL